MREGMVFVAMFLIACSSGPGATGDAGADGAPQGDAAPDAVGPSDAAPDTATAQPATLQLGPLSFGASVEQTQCATMRLGNVGAMHVGAIHTVLTGAWHELVIYRSNDTTESGPADCQPLSALAAAGGEMAVTITQRDDELLQLPSGVGFTFADHQMIRLELHGVDSGSGVGATVSFEPMTDAFQREAGMLLVGLIDIQIPAGQTAQLQQLAAAPAAGVGSDLLVLSGHTHGLSTDLAVAASVDGGAPSSLYDSTTWNAPPVTTIAPLTLTSSTKLQLSCSWNNTKGTPVTFGETMGDEQCFVRAHYAPSNGSRVCIHTEKTGTVDVCCPGDSLCSQLQL